MAVIAALSLCGCEDRMEWYDYSEENILSYAPYDGNSYVEESVTFVSETGDTAVWNVECYKMAIRPCPGTTDDCEEIDEVNANVIFSNEKDETMGYTVGAVYHEKFFMKWKMDFSDMGDECAKDEPIKKISDLDKLLTETLKCDENGVFVIAKGKGLVEYTVKGVKWKVTE